MSAHGPYLFALRPGVVEVKKTTVFRFFAWITDSTFCFNTLSGSKVAQFLESRRLRVVQFCTLRGSELLYTDNLAKAAGWFHNCLTGSTKFPPQQARNKKRNLTDISISSDIASTDPG